MRTTGRGAGIQSEGATEPTGTRQTHGDRVLGWETRPRAWIGGSRGEWDQPLCWPLTMFWKEACAGCAAPRSGPQIPDCPSAAPPRHHGLPRLPKKGLSRNSRVFKEPQVATFLTTLPHTGSPAPLLFLPQSRHPATGLGALGGWEGSQQPSCGLCSAGCDLSKWPKKSKLPKHPQHSRRGVCGVRFPAPHRPAPGKQRGCPLPDQQHCLPKGEENPSVRFLVTWGGKIIIGKGSLAPPSPAIPSGGLERSLVPARGNPERLPPGSGGEGRPALPSRDGLGTGQRPRGRAGGGAGGLLPPLPERRRRKKRGAPGRFQPATILCGGLKWDAEEGKKTEGGKNQAEGIREGSKTSQPPPSDQRVGTLGMQRPARGCAGGHGQGLRERDGSGGRARSISPFR